MRVAISKQSIGMLALALSAGLGAAWFAQRHIQQHIERIEARSQIALVSRVVAAHDLPAGVPLEPHQVAIRQFPAHAVSSDSVSPERYAEQLQGRVLSAPLRAGDAILSVHAHAAGVAPFSSRLGQGRRAITMPIDEVNSASGLLAPGDLIDLYVSFDHQQRRVTAPLLQGVLVLATGQSTSSQTASPAYGTVTLDTSPEDAIKLVAARQGGVITALLRQQGDQQTTQRAVRGDLASLLGVGGEPSRSSAMRPVSVIYGDRHQREIARRDVRSPETHQALFDLPGMPELVSAWLQAASVASGDGAEEGVAISQPGPGGPTYVLP